LRVSESFNINYTIPTIELFRIEIMTNIENGIGITD